MCIRDRGGHRAALLLYKTRKEDRIPCQPKQNNTRRWPDVYKRQVYCLAGCQKPMKRLWISSMEDSAIREGFANLRPGADYDGLHLSLIHI